MFFSVIVPIYNIEKYITTCIESVLAQTFTDYELILVDDGSPDNCPAICDRYAKTDSRIRVIHKANGGLVSARQAGIRVATGDYIFHLDGDDSVNADALQRAHDILCKTGADIVTFSYTCYRNGIPGEIMHEPVPEGLYQKEQMQTHLYPKLLSDENMQHIFYFLWGKAIKRELATPHQLAVNPAISLGEDLSCIVPCYLQANSVYVCHHPIYRYTIRNDSISTDFKTKQITQIADVVHGLHALSSETPSDFKAQISRYSCFMCFAILAAAAEGNFFGALKELRQLILHSVHCEELPKAHFKNITRKSRIAVFLLNRLHIRSAFYFLFISKTIKQLLKKG